MSKITVVLEFEEGIEEPRFRAGMKVLGGDVIAVQFNDALEEIERLEKELDSCQGR